MFVGVTFGSVGATATGTDAVSLYVCRASCMRLEVSTMCSRDVNILRVI